MHVVKEWRKQTMLRPLQHSSSIHVLMSVRTSHLVQLHCSSETSSLTGVRTCLVISLICDVVWMVAAGQQQSLFRTKTPWTDSHVRILVSRSPLLKLENHCHRTTGLYFSSNFLWNFTHASRIMTGLMNLHFRVLRSMSRWLAVNRGLLLSTCTSDNVI